MTRTLSIHVQSATKYTARSWLEIMVIWAENPSAQNAESTDDGYLCRVALIASLGMSNSRERLNAATIPNPFPPSLLLFSFSQTLFLSHALYRLFLWKGYSPVPLSVSLVFYQSIIYITLYLSAIIYIHHALSLSLSFYLC